MSKVGSCVSIFSFFCDTTRKPTIQSFKKQAIRKAEVLPLNEHGLGDLKWRLGAIPNAENHINTPYVDSEVVTDASKTEQEAKGSSNPT